MQDILDIERVYDSANRYINPTTGFAMIQDYQMCPEGMSCLDTDGRPLDMRNQYTGQEARDFSSDPYGSQLGRDFYIQQGVFYRWLDPDFWAALVQGGSGDEWKARRGNYGLEFNAKLSDRLKTTPTSAGYICNLGAPRRIVSNITIQVRLREAGRGIATRGGLTVKPLTQTCAAQASGCHVQVHSTAGSDYSLYVRQANTHGTSLSVSVQAARQPSGCTTSMLVIEAKNSQCKKPTVYRQQTECFNECNIVLFKGAWA